MTLTDKILSSWLYENGHIVWARDAYSKKSLKGDKVPFTTKSSGHQVVSFWHDGKSHKLQYGRIVWLLVNKELPNKEIDHIDRNPANNHIDNLRLATRTENTWNRALSASQGVYQHGKNWRVEITANNVRKRVNGFKTKELAVEFRELMADMLFGQFASVSKGTI